jgi:hypothetical protein
MAQKLQLKTILRLSGEKSTMIVKNSAIPNAKQHGTNTVRM